MDAISFAVGVQSKDLRGRQLKDLIYRSTKDDGTGVQCPSPVGGRRGGGSCAPSCAASSPDSPVLLGMAEERSASVTLVYECDGAETKFMRGIKKDGVGEYRIDGKACKWEAYSARLKSLGVLTQAHTGFLVFQVRPPLPHPQSPHPIAHPPAPTRLLRSASSAAYPPSSPALPPPRPAPSSSWPSS